MLPRLHRGRHSHRPKACAFTGETTYICREEADGDRTYSFANYNYSKSNTYFGSLRLTSHGNITVTPNAESF